MKQAFYIPTTVALGALYIKLMLIRKKSDYVDQYEVKLSDDLLLGRGAHRECYIHPGNRNQCIKIVYNTSDGGRKELARELKFYKEMNSRLTDWSSITRYYGEITTNLGVGYLYDIIKNKDGSVSKTLTDYLNKNPGIERLEIALKNLNNYIKKNKIPTMTIKPQNILCQISDEGIPKLVIVDNLGESTLIPLSKISKIFFNMRLKKKWKKFLSRLNNNHE